MELKTMFYIGLLGLETTGLAERSVALDIAHALCLQAGFSVAFHADLAFDDSATVWRKVERTPELQGLLVCLRPTAAMLLPRLQEALRNRMAAGLSSPLIVFGGATALAAPTDIATAFPQALVWSGTLEDGFPDFLRRLCRENPEALASVEKRMQQQPAGRIAMPAHFSTEQCVRAGGSVWIEASRGCRLNCSFCVMSHESAPSNWFPRPVEDIFDEIEVIQKRFGINYFSFSDLSAFETEEYVQAFLAERARRRITFSFRCDMRLATARHLGSRLTALRNAGLSAVYVGIESVVPGQKSLYGKSYPGREIIDYMQSCGIQVAAGFIMLDPLYSPADFRHQVVGARRERILDLIATPFKTMRVQRGTQYQKIADQAGILGDVLPDLYTYSYRCLDSKMEIVRQLIEFFHQTTKNIYYNPYIEGQLRQAGHDNAFVRRLHQITVRYKEAQMKLLEDLAEIVTENSGIEQVWSQSIAVAERFCQERKRLFAVTATDYEELLESGFRHYRRDLEKFIDTYRTVPAFEADRIEVPLLT